ncbi:MAG: hydantoinase B/oxoprolinase family protein, partial [Myxococcales bacterium]|nr:hydantoinase B/oxoprolinase family protein [Myxococcales bacterium]
HRAGATKAITFDMGGTSTDVARVASMDIDADEPAGSVLEKRYESRVLGHRVLAPSVDVHTVASGGGSLCRYSMGRLVVGPESAGAHPGPLCYGDPAAQELTITDMNVALGRLRGDRFPIPLDGARVGAALEDMVRELARDGHVRSPEGVASGFIEVAVAQMAAAIERVSVARGHDVRSHSLVVFGGAGGQHACAVARRLGISSVLIHPLAGVLSALGMGLARTAWTGERSAEGLIERPDVMDGLARLLDDLRREGEAFLAMAADGEGGGEIRWRTLFDARYVGNDTVVTVPLTARDAEGLRSAFEEAHRREFGYVREGHALELVTVRMEGARDVGAAWEDASVVEGAPAETGALAIQAGGDAVGEGTRRAGPRGTARVYVGDGFREVPLWDRERLPVGTPLDGPLLVLESTGTIFVDEGFVAEVREGVLALEDTGRAASPSVDVRGEPDPVTLEVYHHTFTSIAEKMGDVLQRSALSTNIRDRLDYSCAIFDQRGGLVANAPHIPVHLGAMGASVEAVRDRAQDLRPGDVFATNDPSLGGSHLPDITVVSPIHGEDGTLLFWVASRGHHADVGGITPGSMPPFSRQLADEGTVFSALRIMREGRFLEDELLRVLHSGPHPARRPGDVLADLRAQMAANRRGELLLQRLVATEGVEVVHAYMGHIQANAGRATAEALAAWPDGHYEWEDVLDGGARIRVRLSVVGARVRVDFSGTSGALSGNLNAPRAVTVAAVLYVLRCLVGQSIPLNQGCLGPVELVIPPGSMLDPPPGAAVVGGNVETSQRVVDVLLAALGMSAASQGTMNNLGLGDEGFGYYETIGGGAGAMEGSTGASGVHTHMTNSRITDPEILEARYPLRLIE